MFISNMITKTIEQCQSVLNINSRIQAMEEEKKKVIQQEVEHMKQQLKDEFSTLEASFRIIRNYDPKFVAPWSPEAAGLRIYKFRNAKDACLAVLSLTTLNEQEVFNAIREKFGTTYSYGTIVQALYKGSIEGYSSDFYRIRKVEYQHRYWKEFTLRS